MFAVISNGLVLGIYETREHAEEQQSTLGLGGVIQEIEVPKTGRRGHWKLEKFNGDVQSPETLVETLEGDF
jgi:hypothetical protein